MNYQEADGFVSYSLDEMFYILYLNINTEGPFVGQIRSNPIDRHDNQLVWATIKAADLVALVFLLHKKYNDDADKWRTHLPRNK
jgi:hypothetical protein